MEKGGLKIAKTILEESIKEEVVLLYVRTYLQQNRAQKQMCHCGVCGVRR